MKMKPLQPASTIFCATLGFSTCPIIRLLGGLKPRPECAKSLNTFDQIVITILALTGIWFLYILVYNWKVKKK